MGRRKGELTPNAVDRGWPHQVALPEDACCGEHHATVLEFNRTLSVAPRGHAFFRDDRWHNVFCFAERADAEKFLARFGGEMVRSKHTRQRAALAFVETTKAEAILLSGAHPRGQRQ